MVYIFKNSYRILSAVLLMLGTAACVKNLPEMEFVDDSKHIVFVPSLQAAGVVQTRSNAGALLSEEEIWPLTPATKAAPTTAFSGSAGLIGFSYDTWNEASTLPWDEYMYNTEYSFENEKLSASGTPVKWLNSTEDYLRVYAYAPKSFVDGVNATLTSSSTPGTPKIHYTVPSEAGSQKDLIAAHAEVAGNRRSAIPLTFNHALTAVRLRIGFACTVKSVSITGVYNTGDYAIDGDWSGLSGSATYSFVYGGGSGTAFAKDDYLNDGDNMLMLLPQTLTNTAKIVLEYNDGEDHTAQYSLTDFVWQAGKRVTYTLYKNDISFIYFDLAAGDITITSSTYTGYVYKGGASATKQTVSGTHSADNQYYVYQSSTIELVNGEPNGGYYKSTGFLSGVNLVGATFDGKSTDLYPVTLPVYAEVTGPDGVTPWRDFITNNPNVGGKLNSDTTTPDGIIEIWPARAAAVGRERTSPGGTYKTENKIVISGTTIGTCNLTLDNIYCNYHDKDLVNSPGDSYDEGSITYNADGSNNSLIIRLLGDNRMGHLQYSNKNSTCPGTSSTHENRTRYNDRNNFLIIEGTGSLTVADADNCMERTSTSDAYHYKIGKMSNYHGTAIGSNSNTTIEDVYGIVINSGVIYAGTTLADNGAAIGGGGNGVGEITINGGTVTCVAATTGSALGGGIAFTSYPGIGYVTINDGNVYVYNLDNQRNIPSSAIGGGGSSDYEGGKGEVTINGGSVFAQSSIGTAIGGGSSGKKYGGKAIVNITGGNIIAKSVSGTDRYSNVIGGGSGIGGGTAYSEGGYTQPASSSSGFNGGSAEVHISGSPVILTGSIGGGKTRDTHPNARTGHAVITVAGGDIQGQFVMAAGSSGTPSFTMTGGRVRNSATSDAEFVHIQESGGAVYMADGTFSMSGGEITNCSATVGGAVHVSGGTFGMTGGTIQYCESTLHGGAIYLEGGTVTISGGAITHNNASGVGACGGAIYIDKGSFSMPAGGTGLIENNHANLDGGGVYVTSIDSDVTVNVLSGSIIGNTSAYRGGGLCILPGGGHAANITLGIADQGDLNPDISGNEAVIAGGGLFASGAEANVNIYSGKIKNNRVSSYVFNQDVANELGMVNLYGGDVDYKTVTFNANGGVGADQTQKIVTATNSVLVIPAAAEAFTKQYFVLNGWNTAADGSGVTYADGDVLNISENITLYAQWRPQ